MKACPPRLATPTPPLRYAELHFAPLGSGLSRHWQPWPEIYLDLPWRLDAGGRAPLLLAAADARRWPVRVGDWRLHWMDPRGRLGVRDLPGDCELTGDLEGRVVAELPLDEPGVWEFWVDGRARRLDGGGEIRFRNQLAKGFPEEPLRVRVDAEPLPRVEGLVRGDPHAHSSGTRDMIEFGPPPELLRRAAAALDLDWFALTDHSYDLDDAAESFWRGDPALPRWRAQQDWIAASRTAPGAFVLSGEECSVGAPEGGVLHLVLLEPPRFFPGGADSGERGWPGRSEWSLGALLDELDGVRCLPMAAHTGETPSRGERLALRRRAWSGESLRRIPAHQPLSGGLGPEWARGRALWVEARARGLRPALLAGGDSHGHFSLNRSLSTPLWSVETRRRGLFGRHVTATRLPPADASALLAGEPDAARSAELAERLLATLRGGDALAGDGPLVGFLAADGWRFGGSVASYDGLRLAWRAAAGAGVPRRLRLWGGDASGETLLGAWIPEGSEGERGLPAAVEGCRWLRAELLQEDGFATTGALERD